MGLIVGILGGMLIGGALGYAFGAVGILLAIPICFAWGYFSATLFQDRYYR